MIRLLSISAEQAPWSKSGGLADVAQDLPHALAQVRSDFAILSISPLYPCVWKQVARQSLQLIEGGSVSLAPLSLEKASIWFLSDHELAIDQEKLSKKSLHNPRTTPSTSKSVKHSSVQGWTIIGFLGIVQPTAQPRTSRSMKLSYF